MNLKINKAGVLIIYWFLMLIAGLHEGAVGQCLTLNQKYDEDFGIYKKALLETHPALYRFTSKAVFHQTLDSIEQQVTEATTALDFYRMLCRVHAMIRENHSYVEMPASLLDIARQSNLFPFQVWIDENRMIVTESRSADYRHLIGAEVKAINGQSVAAVLETIESYSTLHSGFNNSPIFKELSGFYNFAFAYYFYVDEVETFQIDYVSDSGERVSQLEVAGTSEGLSELTFPQFPEEPSPPFKLELDENRHTALMTITTFAYWVVGLKMKDYYKFFEESFQTLQDKKIENLVINVCDNRGGEEMLGAELLSYLIKDNFKIYKSVKAKTLDFNFTNELPASNKLRFSKRDFIQTDSGYYLTRGEILRTFKPKEKNHFNGHVYFLASGRSRSATNTLLALVKTHHVGVIIGQESGGNYGYVDGRWPVRFTLPDSRIVISYPAWSFQINSKHGDALHGVLPDRLVIHSKEEILDAEPWSLERVYKYIDLRSAGIITDRQTD